MNGMRSFFVIATVGIICAGASAPAGEVFAQTVGGENPNVSVAAAVQSYFSDIPIMIAIAKCESGPRQFAADGSPLYSGTGGRMIGIFQLDSSIHTAPAAALGFDITTVAGNMAYARYLYGAEGTEPWISSFPCWSYADGTASSSIATAAVATSSSGPAPLLTLNLSLGWIDPQVLILQQLLNKAGYPLAASGPGSPGNETTKFGALTYVALKQFQCAENITCSGDESTTGYGLLNAATRAALLAATTAPVMTSMIATTTTVVTTTVSIVDSDGAAQLASLQSRIAALVLIVNQLEAELAARH